MTLAKDNSVIQTLPADATDDAFNIRILPRASRRGGAFFHCQTSQAFSKVISLCGIAITQQMLRLRLPWKGLNKFLCRPFGDRRLRCSEETNKTAIVSNDDEHEQRATAPWER